jgi:hypothetical protein
MVEGDKKSNSSLKVQSANHLLLLICVTDNKGKRCFNVGEVPLV